MDTPTYPGKGLSLPQLIFALTEELEHAPYSSSFTFDQVSQLDRDAMAALATIREWRNSFIPINRIPLDVLPLIPIHLSQMDRFHASFVCRRWRRTFLHHAPLWSQLYLIRGEAYVKTLLERAKGSVLTVAASCADTVGAMTLLSPHNKQIKEIDFVYSHWPDIQMFSDINSGPFPLLCTLVIEVFKGINPDTPNATSPPSPPLFRNAVKVETFVLRSETLPFLNRFVFPNLTGFHLEALAEAGFPALQLLDFLEGSPMLETAYIKIVGGVLLEGVRPERIVVLPDLKMFSLAVSDGGRGYEVAAHISCPSAKRASFTHMQFIGDVNPQGMFPTPDLWNTIARQYTKSQTEVVILEVKIAEDPLVRCSLSFYVSGEPIIDFNFSVIGYGEEEDTDPFMVPLVREVYCEVFVQAIKIIGGYPLLAGVGLLHIYHSFFVFSSAQVTSIGNEIGRTFRRMGHLEELTIHCCDIRPYLAPFLNSSGSYRFEQPVSFPHVTNS